MHSVVARLPRKRIPSTVMEEDEFDTANVSTEDENDSQSTSSADISQETEDLSSPTSPSTTTDLDSSTLTQSPSNRSQDSGLSPQSSPLKHVENAENDKPTASTSHNLDSAPASTPSSPQKGDSSSSPSSPTKRSKLKRTLSSRSLLQNALSASNILKKDSRSREQSPSRSSAESRQGMQGPVPDGSGINWQQAQEALKRDSIPDFDAIHRALEKLNVNTDKSKQKGKEREKTADEILALQKASQLSKTLLTEALEDRDRGHIERCRGKCIAIVHSKHGDVEAKVFAYNILSTLASPGRALEFIKDAEDLIWAHVKEQPELEKLVGVCRSMRESATAKDRRGERIPVGKVREGARSSGGEK